MCPLDVFFYFFQTLRAESKFWGEISHSHGPKQTRWRRSLRGDAFEPTRHRRHVGAACQASQQSRRQGCCRLSWQGHQASSPARSSQAAGRLTARVVAWEADVSGFLRNEQSIFPYQISFPDEPQMQFLSCPWGGPLQRSFFESRTHFMSFGFIRIGHKSL